MRSFAPCFGGSAKGPQVYLLTSRESVGLRKPHPAQQVGVARVGANPVPERIYCEIEHASRMLFVTLFEQPESFVFVGETRINSRKQIEIDISVRGQVPEFSGDL